MGGLDSTSTIQDWYFNTNGEIKIFRPFYGNDYDIWVSNFFFFT